MNLDINAVGRTLSFELVDGQRVNNLKFVSPIDAASVLAIGLIDPVAQHRNYLPYIPDPKPVKYSDYLYAKFVNADGGSVFYGMPWIKLDSIVENTDVTYLVRVRNASSEQMVSLKAMMVKNGIEDFDVDVL